MANRSYKRFLEHPEEEMTRTSSRRRSDMEGQMQWGNQNSDPVPGPVVPASAKSSSTSTNVTCSSGGASASGSNADDLNLAGQQVNDEQSDLSVGEMETWGGAIGEEDDGTDDDIHAAGMDSPGHAAEDTDGEGHDQNENLAEAAFQEAGFALPGQGAEDADGGESIHSEGNEDIAEPEPKESGNRINLPDGDQPISSEGSNMKKMDSILAVLAFAVKHHLSGVALQDLISLINLHCPNALPSSKYLFGNAFSDYKGLCQFHFYCQCNEYIGCGDNIMYTCEKCGNEFVKDDSMKNGRFFIVLPLSQQLQHLLENTNVGETILNRDLTGAGDDICDITDGQMYKELKREGILAERENFSLLWNTDGVPVFKSSQCSIWPILTMINELPYDMRRQNILLTGLWFGSSKPDMSVFLKPFIDECQTLCSTGLQWMNKQTPVTSKAFCLVCSVDSVARPMIQNMVQFNGFSGCGFCKHKGEYTERAMRYPYRDPPPVKRRDGEFKRAGVRAQETGRVIDGVKGVSIVSFLLYFNAIWGFIPDYMHSVCLGTVRRYVNMWVDPANRQQEWYIGRWKDEINKRLHNLQVTKEISRLPRSLKDIKFWKANEWRTFLYVSPIVLSGILPGNYLAHWCMLVSAIFNLNQTKISKQKLLQSDFYLQKFVMFLDPLYGKRQATFNAHLLLHLTDSVRNWGPLWATSAFAFESFNGYIKTLYAGTRYLPQQIFQTLCYIQDLNKHLPLIKSHKTCVYIESMLNHNHLLKNVKKIGTDVTKLVCLGTGQVLNLSESFKLALQEFLGEMLLVNSVMCYDKFTFRGSLYTSKEYSKKFRRNNSLVKIGNVLCEIIYLVTFKNHMCQQCCGCKEHIALLVENLSTVRKFTCKQGTELGCTIDFISEVLRGEVMCIPYQNISGKCMLLEMDRKEFVISLPNLIEGD